jgi:hypothetical protein
MDTVQRQIGDDLLEPAVLVLQLTQPPHLRWQQPRVFLPSVEIGCLADTRLAADLSDRRSSLALFDDEGLLRVRELRCLHAKPPRPAKDV